MLLGPEYLFPPHQNSYVEILMPSVIVLRGGDLGDDLVMKVEPSGMGLIFLEKRLQNAPQPLSSYESTTRSLWL